MNYSFYKSQPTPLKNELIVIRKKINSIPCTNDFDMQNYKEQQCDLDSQGIAFNETYKMDRLFDLQDV